MNIKEYIDNKTVDMVNMIREKNLTSELITKIKEYQNNSLDKALSFEVFLIENKDKILQFNKKEDWTVFVSKFNENEMSQFSSFLSTLKPYKKEYIDFTLSYMLSGLNTYGFYSITDVVDMIEDDKVYVNNENKFDDFMKKWYPTLLIVFHVAGKERTKSLVKNSVKNYLDNWDKYTNTSEWEHDFFKMINLLNDKDLNDYVKVFKGDNYENNIKTRKSI